MSLQENNTEAIKEAKLMAAMIVSDLMLKGRGSETIPLVKNVDELKFVIAENIDRSFDGKLLQAGGAV